MLDDKAILFQDIHSKDKEINVEKVAEMSGHYLEQTSEEVTARVEMMNGVRSVMHTPV